MPRRQTFAKLARPFLSGILPRGRLFRRLEEVSASGLVWIHGPPGSGKTALVTSLLDARKQRALWMQLDSDDDDVAGFFYYLAIAVRSFVPSAKLPVFSNEGQGSPDRFARSFFRKLFTYSGAPKLLVFDDYHTISRDSAVHAALAEGLAERPAGIQIVIMSRDEPPAELSRLQINGSLGVLAPDELILSREESLSIAKLWNSSFDAGRVESLHDHAGGWAAGFALLLATEATERTTEPLKNRLFDYFDQEVLARVDHDTRLVLLATSLLPDFTESIAASLTGVQKTGQILNGLARKRYFVYRLQGAETAFRYHSLFREFLAARAEVELGDRLTVLQSRAASILFESDNPEAAVDPACRAGDWHLAITILLKIAPTLLQQGRSALVRNLTARLPSEHMEGSPWLQYWRGIALFQIGVTEALSELEPAYRSFEANGDITGRALAWSAITDFLVFSLDDLSRLPPWIDQLEDLEKTFDTLDDGSQSALAAAAVSALVHYRPNHPALPRWTERAFDIALYGKDPVHRFNVGRALLIYYGYWGADLHRTRVLLDALAPLVQATNPPDAILWLVAESNYHVYSGDAERCLKAAERGLSTATDTDYHQWDPLLTEMIVFGELIHGNYSAAQKSVQSLAASASHGPLVARLIYHYTAGILAIHLRDYHRAREESETGDHLAKEIELPLAQAAALCLNLALSSGLHPESADLAEALRQCRDTGYRPGEIACLLISAHCALSRGERFAAAETLSSGFSLSQKLGFYNLVWVQPDDLAELCAFAIEEGIESDYVAALIKKRRISINNRQVLPDSQSHALSIHTLVGLSILREQQPVRQSRKAQKKPLELLHCLISAGPKGSTAEYLAELLWPDADGDYDKKSFHTTMYRLRTLLGVSDAVVCREGRFSLNPQIVFVDVWELEQLLKRVESIKGRSIDDRQNLLQRINNLWTPVATAGVRHDDATWAERFRPRVDRALSMLRV